LREGVVEFSPAARWAHDDRLCRERERENNENEGRLIPWTLTRIATFIIIPRPLCLSKRGNLSETLVENYSYSYFRTAQTEPGFIAHQSLRFVRLIIIIIIHQNLRFVRLINYSILI